MRPAAGASINNDYDAVGRQRGPFLPDYPVDYRILGTKGGCNAASEGCCKGAYLPPSQALGAGRAHVKGRDIYLGKWNAKATPAECGRLTATAGDVVGSAVRVDRLQELLVKPATAGVGRVQDSGWPGHRWGTPP